jgi:ABC-type nickel/cobalt efflux system permease component RcnA
VIALGLVTLFASRYVVPEQLFPWLSLGSGLLVVGMGVAILRQRVLGLPAIGHHHHHHDAHDHDYEHHDHAHHDHGHIHHHGGHTHSHLPPGTDGTSVTWRGLLALGVSGGLLPCPSALIALLGAIALGRAGFGLVLVLAFSVGLAGTLTGVGLLFLSAGRFLERRAPAGRLTSAVLRLAPVGGALGVTVAGLAIVVRALAETRAL